MAKGNDLQRVRDMLDYARKVQRLSRGRTRADIDRDELFELGVTRAVEAIGEAAAHVSGGIRDRYPSIPWPRIAGMRNRLIHGYDEVDRTLLWKTVTEDIPLLIIELEKIVPPEPPA